MSRQRSKEIIFTYIDANGQVGRGRTIYAAIIDAVGMTEAKRFAFRTSPAAWKDIPKEDILSPRDCTRSAEILEPEQCRGRTMYVKHGTAYH